MSRYSWCYQPAGESEEILALMRLIDEQYTKVPFYGWRRMTAHLQRLGYPVNHKRVKRLMRLMGLQGIYPKRRTTKPGVGHRVYPYLLRGMKTERPMQVWSTDITYVPMVGGFMYLVAIMEWYSRYMVS